MLDWSHDINQLQQLLYLLSRHQHSECLLVNLRPLLLVLHRTAEVHLKVGLAKPVAFHLVLDVFDDKISMANLTIFRQEAVACVVESIV